MDVFRTRCWVLFVKESIRSCSSRPDIPAHADGRAECGLAGADGVRQPQGPCGRSAGVFGDGVSGAADLAAAPTEVVEQDEAVPVDVRRAPRVVVVCLGLQALHSDAQLAGVRTVFTRRASVAMPASPSCRRDQQVLMWCSG